MAGFLGFWSSGGTGLVGPEGQSSSGFSWNEFERNVAEGVESRLRNVLRCLGAEKGVRL